MSIFRSAKKTPSEIVKSLKDAILAIETNDIKKVLFDNIILMILVP